MIFKCDSCFNSPFCSANKMKRYQKLCKIAEKHHSWDCVRVKCNSYVSLESPDKHREKTLIEEVIKPCPFCGEIPRDYIKIGVNNSQIDVVLYCKCGVIKSREIYTEFNTSMFDLIFAVYELVDDWNERV